MNDPRNIATRILGSIDWQGEASGYCRCPGEALHTHRNARRDCRVNVDGVPTVHCFHSSCLPAVAEANRRLRRELRSSPWAVALPGGRALRGGDVLQGGGQVLRRESILGEAVHTLAPDPAPEDERLVLATARARAERFRGELFEQFRWPLAQIIQDSPLPVHELEAAEQFRAWLKIWPEQDTIWIGDVFSSGKPGHCAHFRPVAEWREIGPVMGNFTCGSSFKPGSCSRTNENRAGRRFLVVESDTLPKDEVGAIFAYLNRRLRFNLHAIIDTAGKSLHGWFDAPRHPRAEARLKAILTVFGCDPKLFTYSQPVRVPGAYREGRLQRVLWLKP